MSYTYRSSIYFPNFYGCKEEEEGNKEEEGYKEEAPLRVATRKNAPLTQGVFIFPKPKKRHHYFLHMNDDHSFSIKNFCDVKTFFLEISRMMM